MYFHCYSFSVRKQVKKNQSENLFGCFHCNTLKALFYSSKTVKLIEQATATLKAV